MRRQLCNLVRSSSGVQYLKSGWKYYCASWLFSDLHSFDCWPCPSSSAMQPRSVTMSEGNSSFNSIPRSRWQSSSSMNPYQ
ncbi:hypothetical protein GDO78_010282 [Eleutherodactylus coqui]|uniref:Uncharacterized protein n=1 Tax=Eleutherodactylus coqui TaxID=57060 RepID=A0A8J6K4T9_ELECQ|nr:hypothetical protein GDO78_010282 [Eleutherodactylus coqui]